MGGIVLLLLLFIAVGVGLRGAGLRGAGVGATAVTLTPTTQLAVLPPTAVPTGTSSVTATPPTTSVPSATPTATATDTAVATATPIQANTPQSLDQALAQENVSMFAAPDSTATELSVIEEGQRLWVLARSETGNWLYVSDDFGERGFVSLERLTWPGDITTLRVQQPVVAVVSPPVTAVPSTGNLIFNLYQLAGTQTCAGEAWTIKVFMEGQGGTGVYNYFWNDVLLAANSSGSYTFEVSSGGGPVIGVGRAASGNLAKEQELFLTRPTCP
jgi:hypothetical protein